MTDIFVIPKSNIIRFVRQNTALQTLDNRLLYEDTLNIRSDYPFYTHFDNFDTIRFQFISNRGLTKYLIRLFRQDGSYLGEYTDNLTKVFDIDEYSKIYQFEYHCNLLPSTGVAYYFTIDVAQANGYSSMKYISEPFIVGSFHDGVYYKLFQYTYSENDGIYYDETNPIIFECRLSGLDLQDVTNSTTASVYTGYDNNIINLNTTKQRIINIKLDPVPLYFAEILDLAFAHQYVFINGVQYVSTEDSSKYSRFKDSNMFEFVAQVSECNYENYYNLQSTGLTPDIENGHLKISENGHLKISENGLLNIN